MLQTDQQSSLTFWEPLDQNPPEELLLSPWLKDTGKNDMFIALSCFIETNKKNSLYTRNR